MNRSIQTWVLFALVTALLVIDIVFITLTRSWSKRPLAALILFLQIFLLIVGAFVFLRRLPNSGILLFILNIVSIVMLIFLSHIVRAF